MIRLSAILLCAATGAFGQTDSLSGRLSVTSDPPGAVIFLDSQKVGTAPLELLSVAPGRHVVRCASADTLAWPVATSAETLLVRSGDSAACRCALPRWYHLVSDPASVEIVFGDSVIAVTPCFMTDRYKGKALAARAAGYTDELVVLPESSGAVTIRLQRAANQSLPGPLITESQQRSLMPVYLTAGSGILSGVAAAYFKIKADTFYDDYQQSGDPALLDKIHRYDTISGIALVVSQVSLGALAYLLLSR